MADADDAPMVVELVSGVFLLNIGVLTLAFAVVSGAALVLGHPDLASVFGAATSFLTVLVALLSALRSLLVSLITRLVTGE